MTTSKHIYDLRYDPRCQVFYICIAATGKVVVQEIVSKTVAQYVIALMNDEFVKEG